MQKLSTAWKVSKYGVFSAPYFPVFWPEKNPYLDTFHAVSVSVISLKFYVMDFTHWFICFIFTEIMKYVTKINTHRNNEIGY